MSQTVIIAAPGSGQGKTLITTGIVQQLLDTGKRVALYKFGPDYLDPLFLEKTTGLKVRQLDYWLMGKQEIAAELLRANQDHDWVIIEGMMGLYDGNFPASELAKDFSIPVLLVLDAYGMAQSFGAVVHGMASYDSDIEITAVIANRVGSPGHGKMLEPSVKPPVKYWGWVLRDEALTVDHRHLGLESIPPEQAKPLTKSLLANLPNFNEELIPEWATLKAEQTIAEQPQDSDNGNSIKRLQGLTIAVAHDAAFNFLYHGNIDFLTREGASIQYFSPLTDSQLPHCDALYLPGGYPECYLETLTNNTTMMSSVRDFIDSNKPCVAECGGMLYLQAELSLEELAAPLVGIFKGTATVGKRLTAIGYQGLPESNLKGHTFHHATLACEDEINITQYPDGRDGEQVFRYRNTHASFVHWYFSSDPETICNWFTGNGF